MMKRPKTMFDEHGIVHEVIFLDAVFWRPVCSSLPRTKPHGWKRHDDTQPVTCISCIGETRRI